jgi:hypothetical protein
MALVIRLSPVKSYKDSQYGHEVVIYDKDGVEVARIVYRRIAHYHVERMFG